MKATADLVSGKSLLPGSYTVVFLLCHHTDSTWTGLHEKRGPSLPENVQRLRCGGDHPGGEVGKGIPRGEGLM